MMRESLWNRIVVRPLLVAQGPAVLVSAAASAPLVELRLTHLREQAA